jgi:hypothetical protein
MKYLVRFLILVFLTVFVAGCGGPSKSRGVYKKKASMINTTQLGKNKYFFSKKYQRKLAKKKRGKRR